MLKVSYLTCEKRAGFTLGAGGAHGEGRDAAHGWAHDESGDHDSQVHQGLPLAVQGDVGIFCAGPGRMFKDDITGYHWRCVVNTAVVSIESLFISIENLFIFLYVTFPFVLKKNKSRWHVFKVARHREHL